ncbi:helix-turn-helix domain-containing protein [Altererythrobacter sp. GH1-8]|uniref:helix-turn-helix domain-containing protein n=1 Tax=Altererythrobacter sp. GH1-8 TaxID=3349333 RepID=UPI00374CFFCD
MTTEKANSPQEVSQGVPVRAVSRAFEILQSINRLGNPTMMDVKEDCGLPYPTVYRMIMTLVHDGWIEMENSRKRYRPTQRVWSLVSGFQTQDLLVACAREHIVELTAKMLWPVTLSVRVGDRMMVKDSTHTMTSQTFANYYPGYTLPLVDCSAGKAYLAFCEEKVRKIILDSAAKSEDEQVQWALQIVGDEAYLENIRKQGFATHARVLHTENPGKTSAIAAPVMVQGSLEASLALVYFDKAMSEKEAIARYSEPLISTAHAIGKAAAAKIAETVAV